jgi:hypothetical protein
MNYIEAENYSLQPVAHKEGSTSLAQFSTMSTVEYPHTAATTLRMPQITLQQRKDLLPKLPKVAS